MSIDVGVRLFFPFTSAPAALEALAEILHSETGKVLVITLPEGSAHSIPIESAFQNDLSEPQTLAVGTTVRGGFEGWVTAVVRKKKKLPKPRVNAWGDLENFKVVKQRVKYPVSFRLTRDQDYFEIGFTNLTSADVSSFFANPFRSRLAYLYSEGHGVAGIYDSMGECSSFADPNVRVTLPEGFDENKQGIDVLAEMLEKLL